MEKRPEVKTMQEYSEELSLVAPLQTVQEFKKLLEEDKRIHAIQILRKYKVIS